MPRNRVPEGQPSMLDLSSLTTEAIPDLVETRGTDGKLSKKSGPAKTTPEQRRVMQANKGMTSSKSASPDDTRWDLRE